MGPVTPYTGCGVSTDPKFGLAPWQRVTNGGHSFSLAGLLQVWCEHGVMMRGYQFGP